MNWIQCSATSGSDQISSGTHDSTDYRVQHIRGWGASYLRVWWQNVALLCTNMISPWVSKINELNNFGLLSPPGLLLLSKQIKGLPKGWNLQKRCPSCPWREETIAKYESKNPKNPSQDNSNIKHFKHHKKQELIFSQPLTKPEPKVDKAFSKTGNGAHVPGFRFCDCRLKHKTVIKDDYRLSSLPVWSLIRVRREIIYKALWAEMQTEV